MHLVVYIAENTKDHQLYAAKIINTDTEFDRREQMLFLRESLLLHKLDHPSIVTEKMQDLILKCRSENPNDRPSFDVIFEELSSDFSYSEETIDEDEVVEYINALKEGREEKREDKMSTEMDARIASLKNEIDGLKEKCNSYEILHSASEDFITGLNFIHGTDTNIARAVSSLERSSERGNSYASFLLGLLYDKGELITFDPLKSRAYYEKSGQQG